jgi:hypothetical protein
VSVQFTRLSQTPPHLLYVGGFFISRVGREIYESFNTLQKVYVRIPFIPLEADF